MKISLSLAKNLRSSRTRRIILATSICATLSCRLVQGASQIWDGGDTGTGFWSTVANWVGLAAPGATSGTTSTDVATFNAAITNTWGNSSANPITIDSASQNIGGISFDTASGSYFIGLTAGNALNLTSGGMIQILSTLTATNVIQTINAPLIIQGANGTYALANNSTNGTGAGAGTLKIGGGITGAAAGNTVVTLGGSNTNANTISGVIANGLATTLGLTKTGTGTWFLTAANSYSGPTTITQGILNANSSAALGDGSATNTLVFAGGTLQAGNVINSPSSRGVTLQSTGIVDTNGWPVTIAGVVGGAGGLTKAGSGTLILSGANTYTGVTTITTGTLSVATIGSGGTPGNLGAASNAAANLVFNGGRLQYTGASASTDRSFTINNSSSGTIEITNSATNLTLTGADAATSGAFTKTGPGTLTFAGSNLDTGSTTVSFGTLVLDYTATNTSKLADLGSLVLGSATLQLDRASGATGSHIEVVLGTTLSGGASITRGSGSTALLRMNAITHGTGSTVNFSTAGIADTDTTNTNGILGAGWATVAGTDFAMNSTNGGDGLITAYTAYSDVTRQSSGTKIIANNSTANVRIIEGTGGLANLTLAAAPTTINTLNESSVGGSSAATVDLAGQTLAVKAILVGSGAGALTIGTVASPGTLMAAASGGELILENFSGNGLTINANVVNNSTASALTVAGTGTTVLTGANNSYTGATNIVGGTLQVSGGGKITATSGITVNGGALTVDGTTASSVTTTGSAIIGSSASGTLSIQNGGTLSDANGAIGNIAGSNGSVTITGAGSVWTNTSSLSVGNAGTGTLLIQNGGAVSDTGGFIGGSSGATGTATVIGAGSTWSSNNGLNIGSSGTGTLNIQSGGVVANTSTAFVLAMGANTGSIGTLNVTGTGSSATSTGGVAVGFSGSGTLNIQSGGSVWNLNSAFSALIGYNVGSSGTATVSGAGSTFMSNGNFFVGYSGTGTLSIQNGGLVTNPFGVIGYTAGSIGSVTVTDAGSTWTNTSDLYVGYLGTATLSIQNGGLVTNASGFIGLSAGSIGSVTVTGAGSTWTNSSTLTVGTSGAGTLNIQSGGTVVALALAGGNASSGVNLDGGTLRITSTSSASNTIQLLAGGGTFDVPNSGSNFTITSNISGPGALTKTGAGLLTLSGSNNSYAGATSVTQGSLLVSGSISGSTATVSGAGSTLGGTGTVGGVTVNSGAILEGGDGTAASGALTASGNVSLLSGSEIELTLGPDGTHSSLVRTGGTWSFDLNQAFVFNIMGAGGSTTFTNIITGLTGSGADFSNIANWTIATPGMTGTFSYDGAGDVSLTVVMIPEPNALGMLGGGVGLGLGRLRFRRRGRKEG